MSAQVQNARLAGKKALVTGGSRGIGAAIAKRLAEEGADVAITYERSAEKAAAIAAAIEALGRKGVAIQADAADVKATQGAVEKAAAELGGLDILVNNAGIARDGAITDIAIEDIQATLDVNVRAVIVAAQAAARILPEGGRIINIGSCLGEQVPYTGLSVYSASKAALVGFTKGAARDLGPRRITVNVVQPGPVDTDMNPQDGPLAATILPTMAIKAYAQPDDIAGAVAWLASDEGRYVTGARITLDGGVNA